MLIDMGFAFGSANWSATNLNLPNAYELPTHMAEKVTIDKLEVAISAIQSLDEGSVRSCFADCPEEWGLPAADVKAAADLVVARRSAIREIVLNGNPHIK